MAIVVVSRWKGNYEQGLPIVREASPILKGAGATSVRAGVCHLRSGDRSNLHRSNISRLGGLRESATECRISASFRRVPESRRIAVGEEL
jgi:hypothetical protein